MIVLKLAVAVFTIGVAHGAPRKRPGWVPKKPTDRKIVQILDLATEDDAQKSEDCKGKFKAIMPKLYDLQGTEKFVSQASKLPEASEVEMCIKAAVAETEKGGWKPEEVKQIDKLKSLVKALTLDDILDYLKGRTCRRGEKEVRLLKRPDPETPVQIQMAHSAKAIKETPTMKQFEEGKQVKCRNDGKNANPTYDNYPSNPPTLRAEVPNDKAAWSVLWPQYTPVAYTGPQMATADYADVAEDCSAFKPKWNQIDGETNRKSHEPSDYKIIDDKMVEIKSNENGVDFGLPRNPVGRTGIKGRGNLGKFGPNHAADGIVTRWKPKLDCSGKKVQIIEKEGVKSSKDVLCAAKARHLPETETREILQFACIKRAKKPTDWALPGGMVDGVEEPEISAKREFGEEAMAKPKKDLPAAKKIEETVEDGLKKATKGPVVIYKGYVDDPRNTDNSWMETVAFNWHFEDDAQKEVVDKWVLKGGDDATDAQWCDIYPELYLFASHFTFVKGVRELYKEKAYWEPGKKTVF